MRDISVDPPTSHPVPGGTPKLIAFRSPSNGMIFTEGGFGGPFWCFCTICCARICPTVKIIARDAFSIITLNIQNKLWFFFVNDLCIHTRNPKILYIRYTSLGQLKENLAILSLPHNSLWIKTCRLCYLGVFRYKIRNIGDLKGFFGYLVNKSQNMSDWSKLKNVL